MNYAHTSRTTPGGWLAVLLTCLWIIPGLFGHEPWKPDEGYTIGLVKNAVESGDWVVPRLANAPFMEKPPIFLITMFIYFVLPIIGWLCTIVAMRFYKLSREEMIQIQKDIHTKKQEAIAAKKEG